MRLLITSFIVITATALSLQAQTATVTQSRRYFTIQGETNGGFEGSPPPASQSDTLSGGNSVVLGPFGTNYNASSSDGRVSIRADIQSSATATATSVGASAILDTYSTATYGTAGRGFGFVQFVDTFNFTLTTAYNYTLTGSTLRDDQDMPNSVTLFLTNRDTDIVYADLGSSFEGVRRDGLSGSFSGILPAGHYELLSDLSGYSEAASAGITDDANTDLSFTFSASQIPEPSSAFFGIAAILHVAFCRNRKGVGVASTVAEATRPESWIRAA